MGLTLAQNSNESISHQLLGTRFEVASSLANTLEKAKQANEKSFLELASSVGLPDVHRVIETLKNRSAMTVEQGLGVITILPYIGSEILDDLEIDQGRLDQLKHGLFGQMNDQRSGPVNQTGGGRGFSAELSVDLFVRLQAIEDLCDLD